jgi:pimeloyl-ACP methyl ester carboxylesterase
MTMAMTLHAVSRGVHRCTLDAGGVQLSGLVSLPGTEPPRATVVALHGAGLSAGYFDGQADPSVSLMTLGASLGYAVLALDRPGYGRSSAVLPDGQTLAEQSVTLHAALCDYASRFLVGAGLFLLGHSFGGKLALAAAAGVNPGLLGLDISGCGHQYAVAPAEIPGPHQAGHWKRHWGARRLYPLGTFRTSGQLVSPIPVREGADIALWPEMFASIAPRVQVPVRLTFAEYESWWCHDEQAICDLTAALAAAPRVIVEVQAGTGHNISLGWAARSYHLRALAFLEDILSRQAGATGAIGLT